jgi:hypothetical protein
VHSNDEKTLEKIVPSPLSFGAEQKFSIKHEQTKQTISVVRTWQFAYNERCYTNELTT